MTATAIYSTMQGILAALAGADYLALYYNRMENNCTDPAAVLRELRAFLYGSGCGAKLLAASFKNVGQVTAAFAHGAHGVTVDPGLVKTGLGMASTAGAVEAFRADFEAVHGMGATMGTLA